MHEHIQYVVKYWYLPCYKDYHEYIFNVDQLNIELYGL